MADRAIAPVLGSVLLVAFAVSMTVIVGATAITFSAPDPAPTLALDAEADSGTGTISLTHLQGDPVDVETLRFVVEIDGQPLEYQPPIPFFAAAGFGPGPSGPFNSASDSTWSVGQTGSFSLARTNAPRMISGSTVTIRVFHGDLPIVTVETEAR